MRDGGPGGTRRHRHQPSVLDHVDATCCSTLLRLAFCCNMSEREAGTCRTRRSAVSSACSTTTARYARRGPQPYAWLVLGFCSFVRSFACVLVGLLRRLAFVRSQRCGSRPRFRHVVWRADDARVGIVSVRRRQWFEYSIHGMARHCRRVRSTSTSSSRFSNRSRKTRYISISM